MKALITGVSGFIGPHVVAACRNHGWEVLGVDLRDYPYEKPEEGFSFRKGDVRELVAGDLNDVDYVIHLAFVTNIPYSIEHPLETTRDNIDMTAHMLAVSAEAKVSKFVFSSTASLYGNNPTPWSEEMPPNAIEPYSWQKLSGEYACRLWSERYGLPTCSLRLFQVFGENQRPDTALSAFLRFKREGKPITLTETTAQSSFRTGQRDFIYVGDVAEAFCLACESKQATKGEVVNVGTGNVRTMEEIARAVGGEVVFIPRRNFEVERHEADTTRTREWLGLNPKVEVIDWIERLVTSLS